MKIIIFNSTYERPVLRLTLSIGEYVPDNEVVAYYMKDGKPLELGRVSYTPWDNPPYHEDIVVRDPPKEILDDPKKILFAGVNDYPPK
ncbi:hypothetical protein AB7M22_001582 [Pseudomonas sp. ADAK2 TE3594]